MGSPSLVGSNASPAARYAVPGDGSTPVPVWEPPGVIGRRLTGPSADSVRLALRVVVRLDQLGTPGPDGHAREEATQEGLAGAFGVTQGAVSKVLARLRAVKMADQTRSHVPGRGRRVRVYYLTPKGEELAREIEQRFGLVSPHPLPQ
jgi:hypothetical protein